MGVTCLKFLQNIDGFYISIIAECATLLHELKVREKDEANEENE